MSQPANVLASPPALVPLPEECQACSALSEGVCDDHDEAQYELAPFEPSGGVTSCWACDGTGCDRCLGPAHLDDPDAIGGDE